MFWKAKQTHKSRNTTKHSPCFYGGLPVECVPLLCQLCQILRPEPIEFNITVDAGVANIAAGPGAQLLNQPGIAQQRIGGLLGQRFVFARSACLL